MNSNECGYFKPWKGVTDVEAKIFAQKYLRKYFVLTCTYSTSQ